MRKKVITRECPSCDDLTVEENSDFRCNWGNSKDPKILLEPKRKTPVHCKLKREK